MQRGVKVVPLLIGLVLVLVAGWTFGCGDPVPEVVTGSLLGPEMAGVRDPGGNVAEVRIRDTLPDGMQMAAGVRDPGGNVILIWDPYRDTTVQALEALGVHVGWSIRDGMRDTTVH